MKFSAPLTEAVLLLRRQRFLADCLLTDGQEITAHLDAEAVFRTLDRHIHTLLGASTFAIYLTDTAGGQLQIYVADIATSLAGIRGNKVRALATASARRSKLLPDLPSIGATVAGFDLTSWNGLFAPAGTPKPIIDFLAAEWGRALTHPEVAAKLGNIGFEVWPTASPDEFAKYVADQLASWTRLIKDAGIQPE